MKVLVIGSGGREHALCWKLAQSPGVHLYAAPGNPGISQIADTFGIVDYLALAERIKPDLTIVGPEAPLVAGIVDAFREHQFPIVGPTAAAAQIESSKTFAKAVMDQASVPTARYTTSDSPDHARGALRDFGLPVVLKADGLAAGKGVVIAHSVHEAESALPRLFTLSRRVVIEEFLSGEEVSFIVLTDGRNVIPLEPAQDHKALLVGDQGPNTGGMGAYSDSRILTQGQRDEVLDRIIYPTLEQMRTHGHPFTGFLYAGLIMTADGPRVLEFNARLGDPETQALLLRLDTDLVPVLHSAAQGHIPDTDLTWNDGASVCVVTAAHGYPENVRAGDPITGVDRVRGAVVFEAGTQIRDGVLVTAGGRVLGITAAAGSLPEAIQHAYQAVEQIHFDGMQYRKDIGVRGLTRW